MLLGISFGFNCQVNKDDKCPSKTVCNESGICVCETFMYGENCDKKIIDTASFNINKGMTLNSYITLVLLISILLPAILIIGLFLIFIFLKGRDGTYTN